MFKFLIITHEKIGESLIKCVENNLQKNISSMDIISLNQSEIDLAADKLQKYITENREYELIIMTDLFGSSSSNILKPYSAYKNIYAISGLNLAMLMKAATHKTNDTQVMIDEIIKCGNKSIINFI
jgi:PTS system mannose-specific IIA component